VRAEFVQLVSSEANDVSEKDKKTTITPEHVLSALEQLGFSEFQDDLVAFYGDVKESNAQRGASPQSWCCPYCCVFDCTASQRSRTT